MDGSFPIISLLVLGPLRIFKLAEVSAIVKFKAYAFGVGVAVGVGVGVDVAVGVGVGVDVAVGVGVDVAVGIGVAVGVTIGVIILVGSTVGVGVTLFEVLDETETCFTVITSFCLFISSTLETEPVAVERKKQKQVAVKPMSVRCVFFIIFSFDTIYYVL